jgi:hypothetical protein
MNGKSSEMLLRCTAPGCNNLITNVVPITTHPKQYPSKYWKDFPVFKKYCQSGPRNHLPSSEQAQLESTDISGRANEGSSRQPTPVSTGNSGDAGLVNRVFSTQSDTGTQNHEIAHVGGSFSEPQSQHIRPAGGQMLTFAVQNHQRSRPTEPVPIAAAQNSDDESVTSTENRQSTLGTANKKRKIRWSKVVDFLFGKQAASGDIKLHRTSLSDGSDQDTDAVVVLTEELESDSTEPRTVKVICQCDLQCQCHCLKSSSAIRPWSGPSNSSRRPNVDGNDNHNSASEPSSFTQTSLQLPVSQDGLVGPTPSSDVAELTERNMADHDLSDTDSSLADTETERGRRPAPGELHRNPLLVLAMGLPAGHGRPGHTERILDHALCNGDDSSSGGRYSPRRRASLEPRYSYA